MKCLLVLLLSVALVLGRPQGDGDDGDKLPSSPPTEEPKGCITPFWTTPIPTTKNPNCGSTKNGDTVDKGRYYYKCENGEYKPQGCVDGKKQRVAIDQTFEENQYVMKCVLTAATQDLSFDFVACVIDGKNVAADETAQSNWFWYKCTKMPDGHLQSDVAGCVHESKRINLKDRVVSQGYVFECRKEQSTNQGIALWPVACYSETDQKHVEVGQQFTGADKNLYECTVDPQTKMITKKILSCLSPSGKQVKDGETFREGETIYKCYLGTMSATVVAVGCAGPNDSAKTVNAVWLVESKANPSLKYEVMCQSTNNVTTVVPNVCIFFDSAKRQYRIQPGCFVKVDETHAAGCKTDGKTPASLEGFYFELTKLEVAVENKLALC